MSNQPRHFHGPMDNYNPTTDPKNRLLLQMLHTIDELGYDRMAIIDARLWFTCYRKKLQKLGIKVPPLEK
jgi:hypothetical protein